MLCFFFFNDTATTEIYTLSLHDALPISSLSIFQYHRKGAGIRIVKKPRFPSGSSGEILRHYLFSLPRYGRAFSSVRSEEHTSELQSQSNLVCRLLLEKKNIAHISSPSPF